MSGTAQPPQVLKREFTLWSAFAMAFAFISPIVALYAIFGFTVQAGGPASWWGFLFVTLGQGLLALVFAQLVSRWPFEGSIYQWSRRLVGERYGWYAGWAYMWTLAIAMAAVAYGAAGFLPVVLGIDPFSTGVHFLVALAIVACATLLNTAGRRGLKIFVALSIGAEVIGSVGVGLVLLFFHGAHPVSEIFHTAGAGDGAGGYLWSGMLAGMAFIGWAFVGFESAGAIAEEVHEPRKALPKAIILALVIIAAVVMFSALGLILAIPDYGPVLSGQVADPVADTITQALGAGVTRPLFILFVIGFFASLLALQASASRMVYAFAREGTLPASRTLARLSHGDALPIPAIVLAGVVAGLVLATTLVNEVYSTLVNFTSGGFFIAFCFPTLALLVSQLRGRWQPGGFTLGRWSLPLTAIASLWAVFELVNIAWPRATDLPWYQQWAVLLMTAIVAVLGVIVQLTRRRHVAAAGVRRQAHEREHGDDEAPAPLTPARSIA
ncbi:APC family permease [Patulibacter defluvii]|uniref:APC family permease n=1 Tax=Patulibacter defluvii TaxID=3095358 RepID=UPI002A764A4F|nr:APC family permease [Patulibacter sp. DM4]